MTPNTTHPVTWPIMTGADLRSARLLMGLSQADLGLLLGMSREHYNRLECSRGDNHPKRPTHGHEAMVAALLMMHQAGILAGFLADRKKILQGRE